ncbi:SBBP repeat-containing protein [Paludibaculum fermentans]|uniref:SBBP repeat-containing protein n=1 Tax=Paludibaculum fermentans TaxID=1473598 RepID=UPI003EBF2336
MMRKRTVMLVAAVLAAGSAALGAQEEATANYFLGRDAKAWRRGVALTLRERDRIRAAALGYSTFLGGGANDHAAAVVTDALGNFYVAGHTFSGDFPVSPDAYAETAPVASGVANAFVAKFDSGGQLIYCTYLGGAGDDRATAIAADRYGNAYVTGYALSGDFPVTEGAVGVPAVYPAPQYRRAFVSKLNAAGNAILYSTMLGESGTSTDSGKAIGVDLEGNAVVSGTTEYYAFQPTLGALQAERPTTNFLIKLNQSGTRYFFVAKWPQVRDTVNALTLDPEGHIYVAGGSTDASQRGPEALQGSNAGRNFYKTTDGGQHWEVLGAGLENTLVIPGTVTVSPVDSNILYAATQHGVFRSADGGASWANVFPSKSLSNVVVDPSDPGHLVAFASVSGGCSSFVSRDSGASWTQRPLTEFCGFVFDPADSRNAYATGAYGLQYSRDGGDTWTTSSMQGLVVFARPAIDTVDHNTLYIATREGVLRSEDAGVTWKRVSQSYFTGVLAEPGSRGVLYATNGSSLSRSTDGGGTWTSVRSGYVQGMMFDPSGGKTLYLRTGTGFVSSRDGGVTWEPPVPMPPNASIVDIQFDVGHPGVWYVSGNWPSDAFLTKLSADGTTELYSTFFGGVAPDSANRVELDGAGAIYLAGTTQSPDLRGAQNSFGGGSDAFLAKLSSDGRRLEYAKYFGGSSAEQGLGLGVDASGQAIVAGFTNSADLPLSGDAVQRTGPPTQLGMGFYAIFDPDGKVFSSSYLGGLQGDTATAAAISPAGRACIVGDTNSPDLHTTAGALQAVRNGFADTFLTILDLQR